MRTISALLAAAALSLAACQTTDQPALQTEAGKPSWNLLAATTYPADHPTGKALRRMAEVLAASSHGRLTITVFDSTKMGRPELVIGKTREGQIAITEVSASFFQDVSVGFRVFDLPYLFDDRAAMFAMLDGSLGREILGTLEPNGLIGLGFLDEGTRSVITRSAPVRSPKDLQGLKISTRRPDHFQRVLAAMGAEPAAVPDTGLKGALQGAKIAGAEFAPHAYDSFKLDEAAPYFSRTEHLRMLGVLVFSKEIWSRMDGGDRELVLKAARAAVNEQRSQWLVREAAAYGRILGRKAQIVADVDRRAFAEATRPFRQAVARERGVSDLLERIEAQ